MISVWSLFVAVFISQFPTCFAESIHIKPFNINRVCPSCSKSRQPVPVIFANLRYMQIKNNFTYSSPIYWLFQLCCVNHNLHQFFDDEILTKCWLNMVKHLVYFGIYHVKTHVVRPSFLAEKCSERPRFPRGEAEPTWRCLGKPAGFPVRKIVNGLTFHIYFSLP